LSFFQAYREKTIHPVIQGIGFQTSLFFHEVPDGMGEYPFVGAKQKVGMDC